MQGSRKAVPGTFSWPIDGADSSGPHARALRRWRLPRGASAPMFAKPPGRAGEKTMTSSSLLRAASFAGAILAALLVDFRPIVAQTSDVELTAHRAVYELKLARSRGKSGTVAARGRILYDFSGNACE